MSEVKLKVGELTGRQDFGRGIARIDANIMKRLGVKEGDIIEIEGKKKTGVVAIRSYPADIGLNIIRIDGLVRKNCEASIGEPVTVRRAEVKEARSVTLAPAQRGLMLHISPNLLRQNLFMRPMNKGDIIITNPVFKTSRRDNDIFSVFGIDIQEVFLPLGTETRLIVTNTKPDGIVKITDMTEVELLPQAVDIKETKVPTVTYEDIGGLKESIKKVREMIELPLKHPELFERLGVEPPKGVLLHGPPGTGKTLLAKAVANESGANFISLAGPEVMSKWYGQSLPYDEKIVVLENNLVKRKEIGGVVESGNKDIKVLSFDEDGKIKFSKVTDLIKHKNRSKILEVTTRSGRKIKVTDYHSLFTLNGNKIENIKTSEIIPEKTYIAIPRKIPLLGNIEKIDLLSELKENDYGLKVKDVQEYVKNAVKKIGHKKVARILGYSNKYLYDVINKNVGISISKFLKLAEITNINLDKEKIRIHTKGKSLPAILELNEDFLTFLGLWIAEGSYNDKSGVRVSINDSEIEEVKKLLEKLLGKVTVYKKKSGRGRDVYINSTVLAKIMRHVFKLEGGARRKRIPDFVFNLNKRTIAAFLHGYFSGDGSIYPNQHGVLQVEASTESKMLADDLMYLLLYFDIVAKNYERKRENGNQQRIVFTGADNLERFKEIGFMNNSKNLDIGKYLQNINWRRSRQIPITQNIRNLVLSNNELSSWGNSLSIGASVLIEYPEFQNIANNDIYWDRVEKVEEVSEKYQYVYDISVSPTENFVAGFGGIFAHNSEENLRKIFEDAEKNAPSIIFIDEIDALAPKREEVSGEVERRVVSTLLTQMDGLVARGKVIVIAATNRPNAVDPALRRGGRFDREIEIGVPNKQGRKEILQIHTRHMPLEKDISLEELADVTYGYVGADISALTKEAAMHALRRVLPEISALKEGESIPKEILEKLRVSKKDFEYALRMVQPSAMREVLIEVPKVKWSDVGGLEDVKKRMKEAIEWPLKHPDSFERIGIKPPRGILLYGPPGCGKTLLAKAVANEAGANFILINGPEVFSKWVGESERMIRNVFRRAKQVAPSIIFIDEIDALAPKRGVEIGTRVTEQVVSQLLTEMSGVQELKDVVILAATNRPDILDSALLRPGRFDRLIYVPSPDEKARLEIFKVHTKNMPLKGVDIKKLAKITEGYSGADIEALVREAALYSLRENIKSKEVNSKHFDKAIKKIKPSITADMFKKYQKAVDNLKKTSLDETRYIG